MTTESKPASIDSALQSFMPPGVAISCEKRGPYHLAVAVKLDEAPTIDRRRSFLWDMRRMMAGGDLRQEIGGIVEKAQQVARALLAERDYAQAQADFAKTGKCDHLASKSRIKCTICQEDLLVCNHRGSRGFIKCTLCGDLMPGSGFHAR